ncbi:MAG: hypothetical protein ACYCSO_05795 [Cuniculiplasma sp.]
MKYISKESNNLDESMILGIEENSHVECSNLKEFYEWVLTLKPKDVKDNEISERGLQRTQNAIQSGKRLNPKTKTVKLLIRLFYSKPSSD